MQQKTERRQTRFLLEVKRGSSQVNVKHHMMECCDEAQFSPQGYYCSVTARRYIKVSFCCHLSNSSYKHSSSRLILSENLQSSVNSSVLKTWEDFQLHLCLLQSLTLETPSRQDTKKRHHLNDGFLICVCVLSKRINQHLLREERERG